MRSTSVLRVYGLIVGVYAALLLVCRLTSESCFENLTALPLLSIYFLHYVGIPGLLDHDGLCGWGWCAPTIFGWAVFVAVGLLVTWVAAKGVAALAHKLDT